MLFYPESFKIATPTEREVESERDFNARRQLLFDAFTKPELVKRWLLGRSGMEQGMVAGYNRLEQVLASFSANG